MSATWCVSEKKGSRISEKGTVSVLPDWRAVVASARDARWFKRRDCRRVRCSSISYTTCSRGAGSVGLVGSSWFAESVGPSVNRKKALKSKSGT